MGEAAVGLLFGAFGLFSGAGVVHYLRGASASGDLERNPMMGLRTRATLASDSAWREGHLAAVPLLGATFRATWVTGVATVVFTLAALVVDFFAVLAGVTAVVGYVLLLGLLIAAARRADSVAKETLRQEAS